MDPENSTEPQQVPDALVLPVSERTTNSAVDEVQSQGLDADNGPTSKRKRDDVEAPGSDVVPKEAADLGEMSVEVAPMETQGEEFVAAVAASTEVEEGTADETKAAHTDSATEEAGTKSEQIIETGPMAVEREAVEGSTGEKAEEEDVGERSEAKAVAEEVGEQEGEVKDGISGKELSNGNGTEHVMDKSGEDEGEEAKAMETQRSGVEEDGDKMTEMHPSAEGKSETVEGKVDAPETSLPDPKRRKSEGRSVASTAAKNEKIPGKPPCDPERVELLKKMNTLEDMKKLVAEYGKSEADYKVGDIIKVDDLMQTDYEYKLEAPVGKDFAEGFSPAFTPQQMLAYGIFEGKVINDCIFELPKEWYEEAMEKGKLSPEGPDDSKNYFEVKSRLPSKQWRKRGWFPKEDPHGWFQWYCRYFLGRRLEPDDTNQISRWRQLRRHSGQIKKNCQPGDLSSRVKQRQTLLNWSHDCFL